MEASGLYSAVAAGWGPAPPGVRVPPSTRPSGPGPDTPEPIWEDWTPRGHPDFPYARHKTEAERSCPLRAAAHPDRTMTTVPPCIVLGPNVDNYIVRGWDDAPFLPRFRGEPDQHVQFVHEDDLAEAISGLLVGRHAGAFNVTGDGVMTWQETSERIGKKVRTVPFRAVYGLNSLLWRLHAPRTESPAGNLQFLRYPWVASNEKVKSTLGWTPRYDTRTT